MIMTLFIVNLKRVWGRLAANPRQARLLFYLVLVAAVAAWRYVPRPWTPAHTLRSAHFEVFSTATAEETRDVMEKLELLYTAYSNRFGALPTFTREHPLLKVKLYKDREEMRRINPGLGWAEAFYRKPYCRAYYGRQEINPYHWMLHEAVHQLNAEVAHLDLAHWLSEGLAEYFSTSLVTPTNLAVGSIDSNTYPVWWIHELATGPTLAENLANGSAIPLKAILRNRGGPSMSREFNLYYLHWWTLTHFLFETPKHRARMSALIQSGGGLVAFEREIGPTAEAEQEWHDYTRKLKDALAGKDLESLKKLRSAGTAERGGE